MIAEDVIDLINQNLEYNSNNESSEENFKILNDFSNQSKWILVKDRLPEYDDFNNFKPYLVTEDGETFVSHYDQDNNKFCYLNSMGLKAVINVIAWQPLPEPYKLE